MKAAHLEAAGRWLEKHPRLGALRVPVFVREEAEAHVRRQKLVLEIHMLAGREAAFAALYLAWGLALASRVRPTPNMSVEDGLELVRSLILAG